jgi:hypothetical protein
MHGILHPVRARQRKPGIGGGRGHGTSWAVAIRAYCDTGGLRVLEEPLRELLLQLGDHLEPAVIDLEQCFDVGFGCEVRP